MKKNLISSFLGGFVGIILSGYAYQNFGTRYDWLLPIGVLVGSAFGYFFENFKDFVANFPIKVNAFAKSLKKFQKNLAFVISIFVPVIKMAISKRFYGILNSFQKVGLFFAKMYKKVYAFLSHPVNKSIMLRIFLSTITFGTLGYIWIFHVIESPLFEIFKSKTGDTSWGIFVLYPMFSGICVFIVAFMGMILKSTRIHEDQSGLLSECRLYSNKAKLLKQNLITDLKLFIYMQIIAFIVISCLLLGCGYTLIVGVPITLFAMFSFVALEYFKAMKDYVVISSLITTLVITTISYFVFRGYFSNQIIIWAIAFGNGGLCSLVSVKVQELLTKRLKNFESYDIGDWAFDKIFLGTLRYIIKKVSPLEIYLDKLSI